MRRFAIFAFVVLSALGEAASEPSDEAAAVQWADDTTNEGDDFKVTETAKTDAQINVEKICGGATLPWREISDQEGKGKGKGGSKADLLACMHDLKKCGSSAANYARSLPGVKQLMKMRPMTFEGMSNVRSCAVVGNAGHLLQHQYGSFIDNHDLVVRFNGLRTDGKFRKAVGKKTTIRFLNHARSFATCKRGLGVLPESKDITERGKKADLKVVVLWHPNEREKAHECLEDKFQGLPAVNSLTTSLASEMAASMSGVRADLQALSLEFASGMKPDMAKELTSGAQAILLLLRVCKSVSVYGMSAYSPVHPEVTGYQYGGRSNLRFSGIIYHDWMMEALTWRVLNAARLVSVCSVDANATSAPPIPPYVKPPRPPKADSKTKAPKDLDAQAAQAVKEIADRAATAGKSRRRGREGGEAREGREGISPKEKGAARTRGKRRRS